MLPGHRGLAVAAVHVSLNELMLTSYKAALGVGADIGAAEDLSRAAAWLGLRRLAAVSLIVPALKNVHERNSVYGEVTLNDRAARWDTNFGNAGLSAVLLGSSPANLYAAAIAADKRNVLQLVDLDVPLLQVPHFAETAIKYNLLCNIKCSKGHEEWHVTITPDEISISDEAPQLESAGRFCMRVSSQSSAIRNMMTPYSLPICCEPDRFEHGYVVDQEEWRDLCRYADRILVDATEISRAVGAGAGLSDND